MGYIHRNNLKQFPDPYLSPTGYHKVDKERMREFFQINDIGSWAQSYFSRKIRGKHGYRDDPPFHDHYRIYFKRNGDQICVCHEYINGYKHADYDEIRHRSIAWAEKWGYACEVYPPEHGWYCPPDKDGPGAACVIFHKPQVEVVFPQ